MNITLEEIVYRDQDDQLIQQQVDNFFISLKEIRTTSKNRLDEESKVERIFDALTGGAFDAVKSSLISMVMEALGLDPKSVIGYIILNILENTPIAHWQRYVQGDFGCKLLASDIIRALGEAGIEIIIDRVMEKQSMSDIIVGDTKQDSFGSALGDSIGGMLDSELVRKTVGKTVQETFQNEIMKEITPYITKTICNIDFTKYTGWFGGLFGSPNLPKGVEEMK